MSMSREQLLDWIARLQEERAAQRIALDAERVKVALLLPIAKSMAASGVHALFDETPCTCGRCQLVRDARAAIVKVTGAKL